ncbi:MAG: ELWxxDGT repeat protein, partial [Bacteroidota bacterium]
MKSFYLFLIAALSGTALMAQSTLMADANAGAEDGKPTRIFAVGGSVLYRVESADEGIELWISDGTTEGTNLIKDINTDPNVSRGNSNPDGFTFFNGQVYFKAKDATNGDELWVTDGTEAGTVMVKDIQPGDGRGNPFDFIVFNDRLFFTANDGTNSSELWASDGTEA